MTDQTEVRYCRNCGVPSTDRCDPLCWCVSTLQGCEGCLTVIDLAFQEMMQRLTEPEPYPYRLDGWPGDSRYWEFVNAACASSGIRKWWWLWRAGRLRQVQD